MELFNTLALFLIGFFILIKGANYLVNGATSIAKYFNVSSWFIGLVIVGIGTSIPEFSINIASVFNGHTIGLETIIGSNTFNILFILGFSALFSPIILQRIWVRRDLVLNIGSILIAGAAILSSVAGESFLGVTRTEGYVLLGLFVLWMGYMFAQHDRDDGVDYKVFTLFTSFVMIVGGIVGVFFGGRWVVSGAEEIALLAGVSPALVALTIIAAGTSLPELTVSIVALFKKRASIAVSNIIGSNIFDFLGIIGMTAILKPIAVAEALQFDIFAALAAALIFIILVLRGRRYVLGRMEGILMLASYVLYLVIVIWRG